MIYFDNSATTLIKPKEVGEAVRYAIDNFGNAGRSFYDSAMLAAREVYRTRCEAAHLVGLVDALQVAFTSSATESLNLVIGGLIQQQDSVVTTVLEHNSVLRPLYARGCELIFLDCDQAGNLLLDDLELKIKKNTKFLVCTHGSNVTGNITDTGVLCEFCKSYQITMILDVSQTLGSVEVKAGMADILCFTGHKGLFGPQGTGGIITNGSFPFQSIKTGGGADSFSTSQPNRMPEIFEAGTLNSHSLYGLQKGIAFINRVGVDAIREKEMTLTKMFYQGIIGLPGVRVYGDFQKTNRLPVVSLNINGITSEILAVLLWERYGIATRSGIHCAPLLHKHFGTEEKGMVRFSFSYFNTQEEIEKGICAVKEISEVIQKEMRA